MNRFFARRPRGFTLIELVVALALGVVVVGAAALILAQVLVANRRQHHISELQRDGEFASQLMQQEIRQGGLGVPTGFFIQQDCAGGVTCQWLLGKNTVGSAGAQTFFSAHRVLVAGASDIGVVADLPRPDANYPPFGPLHDRVEGNTTSIAWHTENNGTCVPGGCSTSSSSMFFGSGVAACATGSNPITQSTAVSCPWSSRRIVPSERLQIADGQGNWSFSAASAAGSFAAVTPTTVLSLPLAQSFDLGPTPVWKNTQPADGPGGFYGAGFVTTLDRVFFHFDPVKKQIQRIQCWGDPDPQDPKWPAAVEDGGSNALPGGGFNTGSFTFTATTKGGSPLAGKTTAIQCTNGGGTNPEVIARNVIDLQFQYFDATGAPVSTASTTPAGTLPPQPPTAGTLNAIASVAWTITMQVTDATITTPVQFTLQGATALGNI